MIEPRPGYPRPRGTRTATAAGVAVLALLGTVAAFASPRVGATPDSSVTLVPAGVPAAESAADKDPAGRFDLALLLDRAGELAAAPHDEPTSWGRRVGRLANTPVLSPSATVTSPFSEGRRHPILDVVRPHRGLDIAAPAGTPILAPAPGTVQFAGNGPRSYGLMVEIDHGFGFVTRFAHASRVLVQTGDRVQTGHRVALVGATGLVTGPHLHYEVLLHGRQVDPALFLPAGTGATLHPAADAPPKTFGTSGD
jgi:murein DD-endopeptidase MepM/ murein hydrolase activator NlpD